MNNKKLYRQTVIVTLIGVFIAHWLTDITGVEMWAIENGAVGWIGLFLFYAVMVFAALKLEEKIK